MYRIEKIVVRGFRGQSRQIELALSPHANFLIGRNGTGKTTLINLLHAALSMDVAVLREGPFERIDFTFKKARSRIKPRLSVVRSRNNEGLIDIVYRVADNATATPDTYEFARRRRGRSLFSSVGDLGESRPPSSVDLRDRLSAIFQTTWLSLQRGADSLPSDDEFETETRLDIDRKLDRLSNDLTRYFSRLDRNVAEKTNEYQKEWFLSFLASEKTLRERDIDRIDEIAEREALTSIFSDFDMEPATYSKQLDRHFRLARKSKQAFKDSGGIAAKDYIVAVDVVRLHSLVEQWQELERVKESIYEPRQQIEAIATEMLFKKQLAINRSNQVVVYNEEYTGIKLENLSSGEKQLLIFLSETLLQERKPYIFLADEPELSMHVEWQEELVPALLKVNPNAQVLFATHSPDVVGKYQKNVFRMEELAD